MPISGAGRRAGPTFNVCSSWPLGAPGQPPAQEAALPIGEPTALLLGFLGAQCLDSSHSFQEHPGSFEQSEHFI